MDEQHMGNTERRIYFPSLNGRRRQWRGKLLNRRSSVNLIYNLSALVLRAPWSLLRGAFSQLPEEA